MKVLTEKEIESRYKILLENYIKTINIEALTFIDMTKRQLLPTALKYALIAAEAAEKTGSKAAKKSCAKIVELADAMEEKLSKLEEAVSGCVHDDAFETALYYRNTVVAAIEELRSAVDATEQVVPADYWPVPVYADLLFKV
jgi:glutamine synthetase